MHFQDQQSSYQEHQTERLIEEHAISSQIINNQENKTFQFNQKKFRDVKMWTIIYIGIVFSFYKLFMPKIDTQCIKDLSFTQTEGLNQLLNKNVVFYNVWALIQQEIIDFNFLLVSYLLIFKYQNTKVPLFAGVFYFIRGTVFLNIMKFPYHKGIVSYTPAFPSLTVPYGITRDFFYSGHTGFLLFSMLQLKKKGYNRLFKAYVVFIFIVVGFLICTRVHYSIDIVGGIIYTLYYNKFLLSRVIYFDKFWTGFFNIGEKCWSLLRCKNDEKFSLF